jgi:biopolymer transport protein ExbD
MKIHHRFQEDPDTIQMAPLIDIVFLTLIFFMWISVYATLESEVDIQLPTADTAQRGARAQGEIFITHNRDGTIMVNERILSLEELQQTLNRVAAYFPGGAVIIRGDHAANLGNAIKILDCCRKADIQNVAFAALPEEE